jgi:hypothetical protein
MRVKIAGGHSQVRKSTTPPRLFFVLFVLAFACSCRGKNEQLVVEPPVTHPLLRSIIGYGVINASYTLALERPERGGISLGYLRRGAVVQIVERRLIKDRGASESWVLVEGSSRGWLTEDVVDIYDNEQKAATASETMSR